MGTFKIQPLQQDAIDAHRPVVDEIMCDLLGFESGAYLVTDHTQLSDFVGRGVEIDIELPYHDLVDQWEKALLVRIRDRYGLEVMSVDETLVEVCRRVEAARKSSISSV